MDPVLMRDVFTKNLGKYVPSCFGLNLKERIREVNPDYIISTRSYNIDDICLCTLGVPFRMLHCDYELSFFVLDLYGKVQPEMMKFCLPYFDAPVFRTLFEKYNRLDLYNEQDSPDAIMEKIAQMTHQSIDVIQDQFELFGYPLSSEFQKIEDKNQLTDLRKKWNIQPEEIPILLSMEKNGVGVLDDIFDQLSASKDSLPSKYFFVCGKNADLKQKLEQKANGNKRFSIQGLISLQEMNELMNLCPPNHFQTWRIFCNRGRCNRYLIC